MAKLVEEALELARQGRHLESAAKFEQSRSIPANHSTGADLLAFSLYRRALSHPRSESSEALKDLERAKQFPGLPLQLKSLIQERMTAIRRKPDKNRDHTELEAALQRQFGIHSSKVELRGQFLKKYGLSQAVRCRPVEGVDEFSAVGVYRWEGDINSGEKWSQLIRQFKQGERGLPAFFGRILSEHVWATPICKEWMQELDYIVPIPASARRTAKRGTDIVAHTARQLGLRLRVPIRTDLLRRQEDSERSKYVGRKALAEQYSFNPNKTQEVGGRVVLLLDDVVTRGNTASVCASLLKEHACAKVFLLVLARAESTQQSNRLRPSAS